MVTKSTQLVQFNDNLDQLVQLPRSCLSHTPVALISWYFCLRAIALQSTECDNHIQSHFHPQIINSVESRVHNLYCNFVWTKHHALFHMLLPFSLPCLNAYTLLNSKRKYRNISLILSVISKISLLIWKLAILSKVKRY